MKIGEFEFPFRFGQDRLAELCADYPRDMSAGCSGNNGFGITRIFKRYAGLPEDYPVRFAIEHGIKFNEGGISVSHTEPFRTILVPSIERVPILTQQTGKTVVATGFGFLYARQLFDEKHGPQPDFRQRRGTLFFPLKSTGRTDIEMDHADFARILRELPEQFQPAAVCVYFLDYEKGRHQPYVDAGLPVVTAGNRHDPEFLFRLYDLCRNFRYASSNEVGTNLCVSVVSGCRFFYLKGTGYQRTVDPDKVPTDERAGDAYERNRAESWRLFGEPVDELTPEQWAFVDRFFGTADFRSRRELRRIIFQAHRRQEGRPFWHGKRILTRPPDACDYDFSVAAPGDGWHAIKDKGKGCFRWTGPGRESWIDLHSTVRGAAVLKVRICAYLSVRTVEGLEVFVNGKPVSPLQRTELDGAGFEVEGRIENLERGVVRLRFRVPETLRLCDVKPGKPDDRPLGVAISRISLSPATTIAGTC